MAVKYIDKICAVCGKKQEVLIKVKNCTNFLEEFDSYINFDLYECKNCGYISTDIQKKCPSFSFVSNKIEYFNIVNYKYIKNKFKVLNNYPANLYEAFAIVCENELDYDNAIRAYFKTVLLKEAICSRLEFEKFEDIEDLTQKQIKQYDDTINELKESLASNLQKIISLYAYSKKTTYTGLILVKVYLKLDNNSKAKLLFESLNNVPDEIDINKL